MDQILRSEAGPTLPLSEAPAERRGSLCEVVSKALRNSYEGREVECGEKCLDK